MSNRDKLQAVKKILNHLVTDELHPDEFAEGDVITKHLNKAIAIIENDVITAEEQAEAENVSEETILSRRIK